MHEFAYTGTMIDKLTLVKCLGRNSGLVFTKYAEFCFSLLDLEVQVPDGQEAVHWRFYGTMMAEVLRAYPND